MKKYRVFYVDLTEKSYVVDAENKKDAETKAKKKLGKIRIMENSNDVQKTTNAGNEVLADVIRCPKCGGENEYSQGFKQNIQPVDGGDWRQVCFNICDRCGYAIDVWFWD